MKGRKQIKVHEDHNGNIYMSGVVSRTVSSGLDCMSLLEDGAISRTTASTNMNATSSRSHAIFTLLIKHHRVAPVSFLALCETIMKCPLSTVLHILAK